MDTPTIKYSQSVFKAQFDKDTVQSTREVTFVIASEATGREHRNKFLYNWSNWNLDKFNSSPIVGYQHNVYGDNMCSAPNPDDVIAKASAWMDKFQGFRVVMSKATFEPAEINPVAEKVFQKIVYGSLNSASTGVLPIGGKISTEKITNDANEVVDVMYNFPGQELVEWSVVNIPADPAALRRSLKSHTYSALQFIQRFVPELSMNNIYQMKVQDILDLVEARRSQAIDLDGDFEINGSGMILKNTGPDPDYNKMKDYLTQIKK